MPLKNLVIILVSCTVFLVCYDRTERNRYASRVAEAMDLIHENFVDPIDNRDLYEHALLGMTEALDPYSSYIPPDDYAYFKEGLDQQFGGIGIIVEIHEDTQQLTVLSPLVDTPASRAGVRAGDIILAINGRETAGMSLRDSVDLMRGEPGVAVAVRVLHAGEEQPVDLEIERAIIPIESVLGDHRRQPNGDWVYALKTDRRLCYIQLVTFGENTTEEVRQVLEQQRPKALILDLRDNAGGLLDTAVGTSDLLLDQGEIVSIRGRDGVKLNTYVAEPSQTVVDASVPIAVLVNHRTASASEIVAACLQDHGRAKIIGERTWGKGTVQRLLELEGGQAALKLTTARYWRPSGENIHRREDAEEDEDWGVTPDVDGEVILTDTESAAVQESLRQRNTFRNGALKEPPEDAAATTSERTEVDRQLKHAVDYLQKQLDGGKLTKSAA